MPYDTTDWDLNYTGGSPAPHVAVQFRQEEYDDGREQEREDQPSRERALCLRGRAGWNDLENGQNDDRRPVVGSQPEQGLFCHRLPRIRMGILHNKTLGNTLSSGMGLRIEQVGQASASRLSPEVVQFTRRRRARDQPAPVPAERSTTSGWWSDRSHARLLPGRFPFLRNLRELRGEHRCSWTCPTAPLGAAVHGRAGLRGISGRMPARLAPGQV